MKREGGSVIEQQENPLSATQEFADRPPRHSRDQRSGGTAPDDIRATNDHPLHSSVREQRA
jgi:hypothetical protein